MLRIPSAAQSSIKARSGEFPTRGELVARIGPSPHVVIQSVHDRTGSCPHGKDHVSNSDTERSVTFKDETMVFRDGQLSNGKAIFTTSNLPAGSTVVNDLQRKLKYQAGVQLRNEQLVAKAEVRCTECSPRFCRQAANDRRR